jgi:hypothetical protein
MKRYNWLVWCIVILGMSVAVAYAQTGGGYDLTWNTIDSGGNASTGGSYTLMGTLGQPEAGALGGGNYVLVGGFGGGLGPAQYFIYLPIVLRQ